MDAVVPRQIPGYSTEYGVNYSWGPDHFKLTTRPNKATCLNSTSWMWRPTAPKQNPPQCIPPPNLEFRSSEYPSIYREGTIRMYPDGKQYTNPYKDYASKEYGRRLIYDPDHPSKMYPSQWSSELADHNGPYSFATTTGLRPEIPWSKDMVWRQEGQDAAWPTNQWKEWRDIAKCPTYDGYTDQMEYSKYKVQVPQ